MRKATFIMIMIVGFLLLVVPAYADDLSDVFIKFMYGTVALLITCLLGCVVYIANKFNNNIDTLFDFVDDIKQEIKGIELKCAANHPRHVPVEKK